MHFDSPNDKLGDIFHFFYMYQVPVINRYQNKDVHGFSVIFFSITFLNFNLHKITSKPVKTNLFEDCEPLFTEKKNITMFES